MVLCTIYLYQSVLSPARPIIIQLGCQMVEEQAEDILVHIRLQQGEVDVAEVVHRCDHGHPGGDDVYSVGDHEMLLLPSRS